MKKLHKAIDIAREGKETKKMNKTKKILPELRFPEFKDAGEWIEIPIANVLIESRIPSNVNDPNKRITVRLNQKGIEKREVRGTEAENATYFFVRRKKQFIYGKQNLYKGAFGIIPDELDGFESSQDLPAFDFKKGFSPEYFVYYLGQEYIFPSLEKISTGTGSKRIQPKEFFKVQFPFPKLPEQQKIAACLSSLDELISAHSQKLELLKAHKKGLMQNLFPQEGKKVPKLRFPEFKNGGEWKEKELGEIAKFAKGKGISKSDVVENGILPCIRYGELYTHYKEIITDVFSFTNVPVEGLILSKVNDVIIPSSGETHEDIATASCVMKNGVALSGDLNIIRPKINGIFLSYYLNNAKKREIAQIAQGISVIHLYSNQLQCLKIAIPAKKEQQKIASCLSYLDELITTQSKKIEQLKQHKKGLMQGLFPKINE